MKPPSGFETSDGVLELLTLLLYLPVPRVVLRLLSLFRFSGGLLLFAIETTVRVWNR
jgi:hypothetical protein